MLKRCLQLSVAAVIGGAAYEFGNQRDFFVDSDVLQPGATICVVGAGSIGVTTSLELYRRGYKIKLVDRLDQAASFTSLGNAGVAISPSYKIQLDPAQFLSPVDKGARFHPSVLADVWFWVWAVRWFNNFYFKQSTIESTSKMFNKYCQNMFADATKKLDTFMSDSNFVQGILCLYTDQQYFEDNTKLEDRLTVDELIAIQPNVQNSPGVVGGRYETNCFTGDCHHFMNSVLNTMDNNIETYFGSELIDVHKSDGRISSITVRTSTADKNIHLPNNHLRKSAQKRVLFDEQFTNQETIQEITADAFVFCLGPQTEQVLGLPGMILPMKGYSITIPYELLKSVNPAYQQSYQCQIYYPCTVYEVANVEGVRFTCFGELDGSSRPRNERYTELRHRIQRLHPEITDEIIDNGYHWCGHRPIAPDGLPVICRGAAKNSYYNFGHATRGWKQSIGSAKVLADILENQPLDIDASGLDIRRFWGWRPKWWHCANNYWDPRW